MRYFVERQALAVQLAEAGLIAEERPVGDVCAALKQLLDRTVQPNQRDAVPLEKRKIGGLSGCAAAERDNRGPAERRGLAQRFFEFFVFDLPKGRLALLREDLRNGKSCHIRNSAVEIHVNPTDLPCEKSSDGGFAAAHEAREAEKLTGAWFTGWQRVVVFGGQGSVALFALV